MSTAKSKLSNRKSNSGKLSGRECGSPGSLNWLHLPIFWTGAGDGQRRHYRFVAANWCQMVNTHGLCFGPATN
jgi:hypothetical protein